MPSVEELEAQLAAARANSTQSNIQTVRNAIVPNASRAQSSDPYAIGSWGESEFDFKVPSGQLCRMRKIQPEELVGAGIIDQLTRLPGLVQGEIDKAEGARPADVMPSSSDIGELLSVLNKLLPLVVIKPTVLPNPEKGEPRVPGAVYVADIELADRIAIMERVTGGVQKFDAFRDAT
jgi:hypothetical protein